MSLDQCIHHACKELPVRKFLVGQVEANIGIGCLFFFFFLFGLKTGAAAVSEILSHSFVAVRWV